MKAIKSRVFVYFAALLVILTLVSYALGLIGDLISAIPGSDPILVTALSVLGGLSGKLVWLSLLFLAVMVAARYRAGIAKVFSDLFGWGMEGASVEEEDDESSDGADMVTAPEGGAPIQRVTDRFAMMARNSQEAQDRLETVRGTVSDLLVLATKVANAGSDLVAKRRSIEIVITAFFKGQAEKESRAAFVRARASLTDAFVAELFSDALIAGSDLEHIYQYQGRLNLAIERNEIDKGWLIAQATLIVTAIQDAERLLNRHEAARLIGRSYADTVSALNILGVRGPERPGLNIEVGKRPTLIGGPR